jgi:hypothetical protein
MTFKIEDGEGLFHCDTCPEHIECSDCTDFESSRIFAKEKGWRMYIGPDKKWAASCPVCVADWSAEQKQRK